MLDIVISGLILILLRKQIQERNECFSPKCLVFVFDADCDDTTLLRAILPIYINLGLMLTTTVVVAGQQFTHNPVADLSYG